MNSYVSQINNRSIEQQRNTPNNRNGKIKYLFLKKSKLTEEILKKDNSISDCSICLE